MNLRNILSGIALLAGILSAHAIEYTPANVSASIALKVPGNDAVRYPLEFRKLRQERFDYQLTGTESLPVLIYQKVEGGETNKLLVSPQPSFAQRGAFFPHLRQLGGARRPPEHSDDGYLR